MGEVTVGEVFANDEMVDTISITRGKGTQGVIKRFGISRLPRKTRRGLRKVACIGAWHPSAVKWTVARTGNLGYYHRTHINNITPIGGFPHYGIVNEDFLLIRGGVCGP